MKLLLGLFCIVITIVLFVSGLIWLVDTADKNDCNHLSQTTGQTTKWVHGWPNQCLLHTKAGWVRAD